MDLYQCILGGEKESWVIASWLAPMSVGARLQNAQWQGWNGQRWQKERAILLTFGGTGRSPKHGAYYQHQNSYLDLWCFDFGEQLCFSSLPTIFPKMRKKVMLPLGHTATIVLSLMFGKYAFSFPFPIFCSLSWVGSLRCAHKETTKNHHDLRLHVTSRADVR